MPIEYIIVVMEELKSRIWAVGGGKGGVGKSFFSTNLSCALAMSGKKVVVVDADLTGANLHTMLGIKYPERTFADFLNKKSADIRDILINTEVNNLTLISGASEMLELANPKYSQKQKLIRAIENLDADVVIIDIGAGASLNNLDFFNMADMGFIVTSPAPTSIQNAYTFMKLAVNRRLIAQLSDNQDMKRLVVSKLEGEDKVNTIEEFLNYLEAFDTSAYETARETLSGNSYGLVINMGTSSEGDRIYKAMSNAASHFLGIKIKYLGSIGHSTDVERSIRCMKPLLLSQSSQASSDLMNIINKAVSYESASAKDSITIRSSGDPFTKQSSSNLQIGLNDNIYYEGMHLHVQTEDLGIEKKKILTLVFTDGRILYSKSTEYGVIPSGDDEKKAINDMVRKQHKTIIAGILSGRLKSAILT